ncbi:hypothetical protein LTR08_002389 [Meristemomyces frigidus]|nr:hypothetical protein LTR08_002389 [Meristemomyces frigidus]
MKIPQALLFLLGFITTIHALALPASISEVTEASKELFKRKGGGGGGGKGGGGSSSSSSGSGGKGGSSSSTGSSSSGSHGIAPSYGGGRYYGGGASRPYASGGRSPGGVAPYLLAGGALAFFPGIWLYGAYAYNYGHDGTYHNNTSNQNETHPVQCLCAQYQQCGCDNNTDSSYLNSVANNNTVAKRAVVNGTDTLVINGTLNNGTQAATASSAAGSYKQGLAEMSGFWVVVAGVAYAVTML